MALAECDKVGLPPSLRRLHYLLVSDPHARELGYVNTENCYKTLSDRTARARDAGTFPSLIDQTRAIRMADGWKSLPDALEWLLQTYTLDRSLYLDRPVVLIAEKSGILPLLTSRYWWLPVTATRGHASVSHSNAIASLGGGGSLVALYVGDFDPTGLDIDRALAERLPGGLVRVALNAEQVEEYGLPPAPAKKSDSRSAAMAVAHGAAMQVELDALPSDALFDMIDRALDEHTGVRVGEDGVPDLPGVDAEEQADLALLAEMAAAAGVP
jgi:hypothetical protein